MLPYRLGASQSTNTTKNEASRTNAQPVLVMTQSRAPVEAVLRLAGAEEAPEDEGDGDDAAVTPKTTLSTPRRGSSASAWTGGRDSDCSSSWAWWGCGAAVAGGLAPAGAVGRVVGGRRRLSGGVGVGGQGTPFRFGSNRAGTTSRRRPRRSARGRWQRHRTAPVRRVAPLGAAAHCGGHGCADQTGASRPVLRARRTSRRGG